MALSSENVLEEKLKKLIASFRCNSWALLLQYPSRLYFVVAMKSYSLARRRMISAVDWLSIFCQSLLVAACCVYYCKTSIESKYINQQKTFSEVIITLSIRSRELLLFQRLEIIAVILMLKLGSLVEAY